MMGMMDLGAWDRAMDAPHPLSGWSDASPAPLPKAAEPPLLLPRGGGYAAPRRSRAVLAGIVALHVAAIGALALARFEVREPEPRQRVATFSIQEPPAPAPPPPLEPVPPEAVVPPPSAPLTAPPVRLEVPRPVEVRATRAEPMRPAIVPAALVASERAPLAAPAPPRPAPPAPTPIVPPDFTAAQLRNPGPAYPYVSRKAREEGVVLLKVLVGVDGRAARLELEESSGFDRLDKAALKTVNTWRFIPASQGGEPREAWVLVPVTFSLG